LIDTSGTTVSLPPSGTVTLSLTSEGGTLGARSFAWTRQSSSIRFTDAAAVNQWLQATGQGAANPVLSYHLDSFNVVAVPGTNVVSANLVYQGGTQASARQQWEQEEPPCPIRPGLHCIPK
jgi:hypothetical protein